MKVLETIHPKTKLTTLFSFVCDKRWDDLQHDGISSCAFCNECSRPVYLASSTEEFSVHKTNESCVFLDLKVLGELGISNEKHPRPIGGTPRQETIQ